MLKSLAIRDVVLIDRLSLEFDPGLCVLTGETGAGKSILLDALGLALGMRAEARLVRAGTKQAAVTAEFQVTDCGPLQDILDEHGVPAEDGGALLLRRTLGADGRSRAFINDAPVSVGLLRQIGDELVEIHGQFDSHRLMNPATHRGLLDAFGGLAGPLRTCRAAWDGWRAAAAARATAAASLEEARRDEAFLRHSAEDLRSLDPQAGEEESLARDRALMMHGEKVLDAMNAALAALQDGGGVESGLQSAVRALESVADKAEGALDAAIETLVRAASEAAEGIAELERASSAMDLDPARLEQTEERLFTLRAQARKHGVEVDELARVLAELEEKLAALDTGGAGLRELEEAEARAKADYLTAAGALGAARRKAAAALDQAVNAELPPLHLAGAEFVTQVDELAEDAWGADGTEKVGFLVATNPGAAPGPLGKIASGGELARFMLAIKVVLAGADRVPTLIFDEVDAGVGGATAAAVGERLAQLGRDVQVLVVTHSPQVAAQAARHLKVLKQAGSEAAATTVSALDDSARREEIARMLAGMEVTEEARAAALSLLDQRAS